MINLWQLLVPVLGIIIMRKLMKSMGLGNLFNPVQALSMATGAAGAAAKEKSFMPSRGRDGKMSSSSFTRAAQGMSLRNGADKAVGWWKGGSKSRKALGGVGRGAKALVKSGASTANKEKRQALLEKVRNPRQAAAAVGAAMHAKLTSKGSYARTAGAFAGGMLARAGMAAAGEERGNLRGAFESFGNWADPGSIERKQKESARDLNAQLSGELDPVKRQQLRQLHLENKVGVATETMLGDVTGAPLAVDLKQATQHLQALSQKTGIPEHQLALDVVSGVTMMRTGQDTVIPDLGDANLNFEAARHGIHWLPKTVTAMHDGESVDHYNARMTRISLAMGLIDEDGTALDALEHLGIKDTPENRVEIQKLAEGKKSKFQDRVIEVPQEVLRSAEIGATTATRPLDVKSRRESLLTELENGTTELSVFADRAEKAIEKARSELTSASGRVSDETLSTQEQQAAVNNLASLISGRLNDAMKAATTAASNAAVISQLSDIELVDSTSAVNAADAVEQGIQSLFVGHMAKVNRAMAQLQSADPGNSDELRKLSAELNARVEDALSVANEELEQKIAAATADVQKSRQDLAAAVSKDRRGVARATDYAPAVAARLRPLPQL